MRGERSGDPAPIADVVAHLLGRAEFASGIAIGRLARNWPQIVGDRLASETAPERMEGGTLVVAATSGPWGAQAKFLAEEIKRSANEALGDTSIERVRVVVAPARRTDPEAL